MRLLNKQLTKELMKNKIFVVLMLILTTFTSFMYFFVHFSIDGNMQWLNSLTSLTKNQQFYRTGLESNITLAASMLAALIAFTAFVFVMFYYRFFKANGKQLGSLKALGFKDSAIREVLMVFTLVVSMIGAILGLIAGYFASTVLIRANQRSYLMTDLTRSLNGKSVVIGLCLPAIVFCLMTLVTYTMIHRKEIAVLLSGVNNKSSFNATLRMSNRVAKICPKKRRFSVRLALRKPIAVFLIVVAVMCFSVMFLMAYSLIFSSQTVYESQTTGHYEEFDTQFEMVQSGGIEDESALCYLTTEGVIEDGAEGIPQTVVGVEGNMDTSLLELMNSKKQSISLPEAGHVIISSRLEELYGLEIGDTLTMTIGDHQVSMLISAIAWNATSNWVYVNKAELAQLLSLSTDSYNGTLSLKKGYEGGTIITRDEKLEELDRASVSNQSSSVINQVVGCISGCILLFLALFMNFQDSTRDIIILNLMGYPTKEIKKMLINIYHPIVIVSFFLTLWPSVLLVKSILRSLSIQIGDYMPFQTNVLVLVGIFVMLNVVYVLVQALFQIGIRRVIKKERFADYSNAE